MGATQSKNLTNQCLNRMSTTMEVSDENVTINVNRTLVNHIYLTISTELHYQFLMPVFWESFIPTIEKFWSQATPDQLKEMITSFPYERWEVEQTLFQFQDAAGKLIHYQKKSKFKKCSCMFNNPKAKQCVFKK